MERELEPQSATDALARTIRGASRVLHLRRSEENQKSGGVISLHNYERMLQPQEETRKPYYTTCKHPALPRSGPFRDSKRHTPAIPRFGRQYDRNDGAKARRKRISANW